MRIFITGSNGFVGPYLAQACLDYFEDCTLYGFSTHVHTPSPQTLKITNVFGDISDYQQISQALITVQPDVIFHLAAQSSVAQSWHNPADTFNINVNGTINLLEAVRKFAYSPKILLVGSSEQYGIVPTEKNPISEDYPQHPVNPYAISKVTQDMLGSQYFSAYSIPIFRARAFNHIGPRQSPTFVIASFCQQIARIEFGIEESVIQVGNLSAQRDFLPVTNVADAYAHIVKEGIAGDVYNIGSGVAHSIENILHMLLSLSRVHIDIHIDPSRFRQIDIPVLVADTTKIQNHTLWRPDNDLTVILEKTLDYWRNSIQQDL